MWVRPRSRPPASVSQTTAFLMSSMLADVVASGTAAGARAAGFKLPAGGKTGTTDDYSDAWFVGYTPHLVAGVWFGLRYACTHHDPWLRQHRGGPCLGALHEGGDDRRQAGVAGMQCPPMSNKWRSAGRAAPARPTAVDTRFRRALIWARLLLCLASSRGRLRWRRCRARRPSRTSTRITFRWARFLIPNCARCTAPPLKPLWARPGLFPIHSARLSSSGLFAPMGRRRLGSRAGVSSRRIREREVPLAGPVREQPHFVLGPKSSCHGRGPCALRRAQGVPSLPRDGAKRGAPFAATRECTLRLAETSQ